MLFKNKNQFKYNMHNYIEFMTHIILAVFLDNSYFVMIIV